MISLLSYFKLFWFLITVLLCEFTDEVTDIEDIDTERVTFHVF